MNNENQKTATGLSKGALVCGIVGWEFTSQAGGTEHA